jgi:oligopeptide/dipeptide ABC transporter ATP-binding protein
MIYITHNLGVVSRIGDRVCVLYAGQVFEIGDKSQILGGPVHPYTKGLLASLPHLSVTGRAARLSAIPGEFPDLTKPLQGCAFAMRCPFVEDRCRSERQEIVAGPMARSALLEGIWPWRHALGPAPNQAGPRETLLSALRRLASYALRA